MSTQLEETFREIHGLLAIAMQYTYLEVGLVEELEGAELKKSPSYKLSKKITTKAAIVGYVTKALKDALEAIDRGQGQEKAKTSLQGVRRDLENLCHDLAWENRNPQAIYTHEWSISLPAE